MQKLLLFLSAIAFVIGCTDASKTTTKTETTSAERNRNNMNMVYRAIESGNTAGLDSVITTDIVDHDAGGNGGELRGLDSLKRMFQDMHNHFDNMKMENISTATDGDYVFGLVRMTGTTKDASQGMPANTPFDLTTVDVVKMNSEGKATEHWGYMRPADMMKMMGGAHPAAATPKMDNKMSADTTKK